MNNLSKDINVDWDKYVFIGYGGLILPYFWYKPWTWHNKGELGGLYKILLNRDTGERKFVEVESSV